MWSPEQAPDVPAGSRDLDRRLLPCAAHGDEEAVPEGLDSCPARRLNARRKDPHAVMLGFDTAVAR